LLEFGISVTSKRAMEFWSKDYIELIMHKPDIASHSSKKENEMDPK
jgi:hypothetical protein